jgi:hypothetical protein
MGNLFSYTIYKYGSYKTLMKKDKFDKFTADTQFVQFILFEYDENTKQYYRATKDGKKWENAYFNFSLEVEDPDEYIANKEKYIKNLKKNWINPYNNSYWTHTKNGMICLTSSVGEKWVETTDGKEWIKTDNGNDWMQFKNKNF